ncbi:MAG TPA: hypothetical protein DCG12_04855 [Planctomycetaceae bacterium]|nr:hypothetical protein [Planctomycetaceae bacterium]
MSTLHYRIRLVLTLGVVLLLTGTAPLTYALHVVDDEAVESNSCSCDCCHHSSKSDSNSKAPSEPHDSDSCQVCQSAFARSLSVSVATAIPEISPVRQIKPPRIVAPVKSAAYTVPKRGPPC